MPDGKRQPFYGSTPAEAERLKAKYIAENTLSSPSLAKADAFLLNDFAVRYWYPTFHFNADLTREAYISTYKNHIGPYFGHRYLIDLDHAEIQEHLNFLAQEGKRNRKGKCIGPLGAKKVREVRERIINILDLAVTLGKMPHNPAKATKGPKKPQKRQRKLSIAKALEISEATRGGRMHAPCVLIMVLGLRRGEIAALRWTDLDRQGLELTVHEQIIQSKGGAKRSDVKTESSRRTLPLTKELVELIDTVGNLDHDYIAGWKGEQWMPPDKITSLWRELRVGLKMDDWHFHDLRHGAYSLLRHFGVDLVTISRILGHSHIDTTLLYSDDHEEEVRKALGDVAKAFKPDAHPGHQPPVSTTVST